MWVTEAGMHHCHSKKRQKKIHKIFCPNSLVKKQPTGITDYGWMFELLRQETTGNSIQYIKRKMIKGQLMIEQMSKITVDELCSKSVFS